MIKNVFLSTRSGFFMLLSVVIATLWSMPVRAVTYGTHSKSVAPIVSAPSMARPSVSTVSMRSTSAMQMSNYAPSTGQVNSGQYNRGTQSRIHKVGATSPNAGRSGSPYRPHAAAGPRRAPGYDGTEYGQIVTDEDGTWWWDDEDWLLITAGEEMTDVTQPVGDALLPLLLFAMLYVGWLLAKRRRKMEDCGL